MELENNVKICIIVISLLLFVAMVVFTIWYFKKANKYKYNPLNWNIVPAALGTILPLVSLSYYLGTGGYSDIGLDTGGTMLFTYFLLIAPLILSALFLFFAFNNCRKRTSTFFAIVNLFVQAIMGYVIFATLGLIIFLFAFGAKKISDDLK